MSKITRLQKGMLSSSVEEAALAWAATGVRVLAIWGIDDAGHCCCGDATCKSAGKHPISKLFPSGHLSATTEEADIRRAFRRYPGANLAIVPAAGYIVVDVDGSAGAASFQKLGLPETAREKTGRGTHHLYRLKGDLPRKLTKLKGIDLKADNGYVVVAPSTHHSRRRYRWLTSHREIAIISPEALSASSEVGNERRSEAFHVKEGSRDNTLTSIAGSLRFRGIGGRALERTLTTINNEICTPPLTAAEVRKIATSIGSYPSGAEEAFMDLADVEEEEVEFLLKPYLVRGAANVLDGNMGEGKSTFTCAIAAAVTTGKAPPFAKSIEQGNVLVLSAEDDPARALKPRMIRYGADVSRIRFQNAPFTLNDSGMALLRQECEQHRPLLIIIDPVIAYMAEDVDGNSANDTMRFIVKLDYLAREFNSCILLVRHFRKAKSDTPMHRGVGSIALSARVRSGLMLGRHPDGEDLRIVAHSKHNYSKKGPSLVFELKDDEEDRPPALIWHEPRSDLDEYNFVEGQDGPGRPDTERALAKEFLLRILAKGPLLKAEIDTQSSRRSLSEITIRRAADDLGIIKGKKGQRSIWSLPNESGE